MHAGLLGYIFTYVISTVHDIPEGMGLDSFASGTSQAGDSVGAMDDTPRQLQGQLGAEDVPALEMETQTL